MASWARRRLLGSVLQSLNRCVIWFRDIAVLEPRTPKNNPCISLRNTLIFINGSRSLDISFRSRQLRKDCNDPRRLVSRYGADAAAVISRRLDDFSAANTLEDLRNLPGRLHPLVGDRAGQLSLDLRGPYRLILVPAHDPSPQKPDGGLDWAQVTAVEIIGIEDTHG